MDTGSIPRSRRIDMIDGRNLLLPTITYYITYIYIDRIYLQPQDRIVQNPILINNILIS